jgi:hypothetical protein
MILLFNNSFSQSSNLISIRPGPENSQDADVWNIFPDSVFDYVSNFDAVAWTYGGNYSVIRGFIKFDIPQLPPNSILDSARLYLYYNPNSPNNGGLNAGANSFNIHEVNLPWNSNSITWNNQPSISTINSSYITGPSFNPVDLILNVDASIQSWLNNPSLNQGWRLSLDVESTFTTLLFSSSEDSIVARRPMLNIWYSSVTSTNQNIDEINNISIFPNPTTRDLNIESTNANFQSISIYNSLGEFVNEISNEGKKLNTIDVSNFQNGSYYLKLKTTNSVYHKHFIKL